MYKIMIINYEDDVVESLEYTYREEAEATAIAFENLTDYIVKGPIEIE